MTEPRPRDAMWVARWACERAYAAGGEHRLWLRWVGGGPGWWVAHEAPRAGLGWTLVAEIGSELAASVDAGGTVGWWALQRLAHQVEDALAAR